MIFLRLGGKRSNYIISLAFSHMLPYVDKDFAWRYTHDGIYKLF